MTLALIDGDIVAYRAAAAAERDIDWGDGEERTSHADAAGAAKAAIQNIDAWQSIARCKDVIVAFTGRGNFRKHVLPTYKGNRTKAKPLAYLHTVSEITDRFETRVVDGLEADDILGIMLTNPKYADAVCLTLDKDLRNVPGRHMNPVKEKRPVNIKLPAADYAWMMQTLHGDAVDGYVGIPRVGPARAAKLLPSVGGRAESMWGHVVDAYRKAGLTEAVALQMARVARILRFEDYDKPNKAVRLWHPTRPESLALATI